MGTNGKVIRKDDLGFWEKIYIPEILRGMKLTISQMFKPKFTIQYPEQKFTPPSSFRGRPVLVEENGVERCVACGLCSRVCPALAIEVQASETELAKERYPIKFEINMVRCIFCGFCEEVCPEEAIVMSKEYELVFSSQQEAIFGKDRLLMSTEKLKDRLEFLRNHR
jgi:NADH-quinone oxidoreductase subunit I